jgi:ferredoxin-type protein NapH
MKPNLKIWRRLVQISVALAFILIPYLNHRGFNSVRGNFLAFNAGGLPLADPLAVLQVGIKSWHLPANLLIGAGIALILAMILGTVFCSWICPFGLLSEWLHHLSQKVWPRIPGRTSHQRRGVPIKLVLFGLGLVMLNFLSDTLIFNQLSLPGWYSRIFQLYFNQAQVSWAAGFLTGVLLVEFVAQNRLWCRYICPQSLMIVAVRLLNLWHLKVVYTKENCICGKGENPCHRSCHLGLNPKTLPHPHDLECTNCGDCVVICKNLGQALKFQFRRSSLE